MTTTQSDGNERLNGDSAGDKSILLLDGFESMLMHFLEETS